jgi:6-phosphofructokinase
VEKGKNLEFYDMSKQSVRNAKRLGIDCLVVIGGDGTLGIASRLNKDGIPAVCVPKTIDNDLRGTDVTFGFDSAVAVATEGIDRIHTTAQSHNRVMIVEVMGHRAGWIALHSGIAGGGDIILLPEIPYKIESIVGKIRERIRRGPHPGVSHRGGGLGVPQSEAGAVDEEPGNHPSGEAGLHPGPGGR